MNLQRVLLLIGVTLVSKTISVPPCNETLTFTLYNGGNFDTGFPTMEVLMTQNECYNLPQTFDDVVSSIQGNDCVILYDGGGCVGGEIRLEQDNECRSILSECEPNFNDKTSSLRLCPRAECTTTLAPATSPGPTPSSPSAPISTPACDALIDFTLYNGGLYDTGYSTKELQMTQNACYNLPPEFDNVLSSIKGNDCVILYDGDTCTGDELRLEVNNGCREYVEYCTPAFNDRTTSLRLCPRAECTTTFAPTCDTYFDFTAYSGANYDTAYATQLVQMKQGVCYNLPPSIDDALSSIKGPQCVILYDIFGCTGEELRLEVNDGCRENVGLCTPAFNDKTSALRLCPRDECTTTTTTTTPAPTCNNPVEYILYAAATYDDVNYPKMFLQMMQNECYDLPSPFNNVLSSIKGSECVILYDYPACTGQELKLTPGELCWSNLGQCSTFFNDRTSSMKLCPKNECTTTTTQPPCNALADITLYAGATYDGAYPIMSQQMGQNVCYDLPSPFNNVISSIKGNACVVLYDGAGCSGQELTLTEADTCRSSLNMCSSNFNDKTTSMRLCPRDECTTTTTSPSCDSVFEFTLYDSVGFDDTNYKKTSMQLGPNVCYDLPPSFDNVLSSIKGDACIILYDGRGCSGQFRTLAEDAPCRSSINKCPGVSNFNDKTSSMKLCPRDDCTTTTTVPPCEELFEFILYNAARFDDVSYPRFHVEMEQNKCYDLPEAFNNVLSSLKGDNCVVLYDGAGCTGQELTLTEADTCRSSLNLCSSNFNDKTTSLKLCPRADCTTTTTPACDTPIDLELFNGAHFDTVNSQLLIQLIQGECYDLPPTFDNVLSSIKGNDCVILYDGVGCTGEELRSSKDDTCRSFVSECSPSFNDKTSSLKLCPRQECPTTPAPACDAKIDFTLYNGAHYSPNYNKLALQMTQNVCYNLTNFDNQLSSIQGDDCVILYDGLGCTGQELRLTKSDTCRNFVSQCSPSFNDKSSSVKLCPRIECTTTTPPPCSAAIDFNLFNGADYDPGYSQMAVQLTQHQCFNMPTAFDNVLSSIKGNHCVILYDGVGCTGTELRLEVNNACRNNVGSCATFFNDRTSSMKLCPREICTTTPAPACNAMIPVQLFDGANYNPGYQQMGIQLTQHQCYNMPSSFDNVLSSIKSGDCVILYDGVGCTGTELRLSTTDTCRSFVSECSPSFNDKTSSMKLCPRTDCTTPPPCNAMIDFTFYNAAGYDDVSFPKYQLRMTQGQCYDLTAFSNRISSVKGDDCLILYDFYGCSGQSVRLATNDTCRSNVGLCTPNFNDKASSASLCPRPECTVG